jgi:hypothetical protein
MTLHHNHIPAASIPQGKDFPQNQTPLVYPGVPASHTDPLVKIAQVIPEQAINETVDIYEEALPYIRCEIQSTIQHESGHRQDEESRTQARERGEDVVSFDEFAAPGRAEPVAEKEEEECKPPEEVSGRTISVNLNQVFEEAVSAANLPPAYRRDVKAGTLDPRAQGMYLMQDLPTELAVSKGRTANAYEGFDGTLWVDVRKIVEPFIAPRQSPQDQRKTHPTTFQDDGTDPDVPGVSREVPAVGAVSAVPAAPEVGAR